MSKSKKRLLVRLSLVTAVVTLGVYALIQAHGGSRAARALNCEVGTQSENSDGCHGLVPWRFTLAARSDRRRNSIDATGLPRGVSRSVLTSKERNPGQLKSCS